MCCLIMVIQLEVHFANSPKFKVLIQEETIHPCVLLLLYTALVQDSIGHLSVSHSV